MQTEEQNRFFRARRVLAVILSMAVLLTLLCPLMARAEEPEQKTVRVGYVNSIDYEEGGEGEYKRGAGYEYLQRISYLTGWNYEYVYGSFKECYEMLANGEIDLFGNVSYKPERAEQISFSSYPQGKDAYILYTTKDRTDLAEGDIQKLNGCKIGVTDGSYQDGLLVSWLKNNEIDAEVLRYNGYDTLMAALDAGELDAIATTDLSSKYNYYSVVSIGFSEYYFAVSKSRPDLLKELNEALYEIQNSEKDYNSQLASRYFSQMTGHLMLNSKEREWLTEHDNTIRLGYLSESLPFCGEENGELVGVLKTVADTLGSGFKAKVETVAYSSRERLEQALRDGEIDIGGPVINDFYLAEQTHFVLTNNIMDTTPVIVYKGGDVNDSLQKIAAANSCVFTENIARILFPDAEIYLCDSEEECLKAVTSGKAGCTLVPSAQLNILLSDPLMEKLQIAEMARKTELGLVATKENRRAASIVNKAIAQASDVLNGVVMTQNSVVDTSVSFTKFLREHAKIFITLASSIILVMAFLIWKLLESQKKLAHALAEAQSASIAKTTFLSNMSHDIRTPMNAIMGFTTIAMKNDPKPEVQNCLKKIEDSSEHLLSLINDVLDISSIESGKIKYEPVPADLNAVTDSVLNIMNGFLVNRDLQFHIHKEKLEHPYVLADVVRIREVLVNILGNAVKFTNDGGNVTFEMESRPGKDPKHIVVRYRITDDGVGMSEEFQKHIFEEFAQEESGARTQYKGTGLGMTISKQYVELMGGTISVESKKGVGSTFTVEIPFELTEKENVVQDAPVDRSNLAGVNILLAEDNDLNAEIAAIQLEEQGMKVTRAVDGEEAVGLFRNHPAGTFDVILMDIMMPRMNGREAAKNIRNMADRPDGKTIPIIAMTANAFAEDVQSSLDAGMNAHLSKPIVMDEVVKTIARNLSR